MEDLIIEKTQSTPFIHFSQSTNILTLHGESFPENSAKFYAPVLEWLKEFMASPETRKATLEFEIIYFNSSSSKVFMTMFDLLQEAVRNGKEILVNWKCDEKNETAIECGEEFKEDLDNLPFNIVLI
ncbi:DUF1987 domain-containing protein [Sinanaerobacter chloroacetimidivorans]|jgi:hypothetical protein|uniref:DUF1987 domain-containing protein n=1 Tax=Sinanaerobacter chloroacetimidivorans TaxID=2818044 RepID=A0A8J7VYH9_9FIRM|nr:DUF1987 domain-containing protein [Sinanaerobacter chloroacetimidivorans]MBR0597404.1 DUF1987 domain-containing protein [Sinanaerobacter chloroacetimidivorans]